MPIECQRNGECKVVKKGLYSFTVVCLAVVTLMPLNIIEAAESKSFLIINKAVNELAYFKDGELIKVFDVGTGKSRKLTPEGTFKIINKVKNRPYYKEKIPGGSPRNPLGDRWMGLDVPGTWGNTYGIHGNNNEKSIGKYVSAGCIRMHNSDIRWLYDQISTGTTVLITHQNKDFLTIASENGFKVKLPKIEKVDKHVTAFSEKSLYEKPIQFKGYVRGKIGPQSVTVFEETDNGWYHIYTWFGDAWISKANTVEGKLEKKESKVTLSTVTSLYASPNLTAASVGALNPQTVTAFEQIGNWYHIYTWFGEAWIYVEDSQDEQAFPTIWSPVPSSIDELSMVPSAAEGLTPLQPFLVYRPFLNNSPRCSPFKNPIWNPDANSSYAKQQLNILFRAQSRTANMALQNN